MSSRFGFRTTPNADFSEVRSTRGNDPDYLYYNAQIINNSTSTITKAEDPEIRYQDTRSVPILNDKSTYAVSVENFTLNGAGKNLPIFIPQIREYNSDGSKNTNPNNTVYDLTLTIQYGGTKASPSFVYQSMRSVQWIPENQATWTDKPAPVGLYSYPQEEIAYYYCYSYSHWVKLVNTALQLAWEDIINAAKTGGIPGLTIVVNSLNGTFTPGGLVYCIPPGGDVPDAVATALVASFSGNTLVVYNNSAEFPVGFLVAQEPDVGTASITTVTISSANIPEVTLGTKCPFYTYDSKTNLFSLWQDSNTCVVPFGSSQTGAQSVFGASNATGYVPGEYSFIGYNTNFESLFTNWDTTYYSNQVKYAYGVSINSPTGLEPVGQSTAVNTSGAEITSFSGNQMTVSWSATPVEIPSSNWVFGAPLTSAGYVSGIAEDSTSSFVLDNAPITASYVRSGYIVTGTSTNGNVIRGSVVSFDGENLLLSIIETKLSVGYGWTFSFPIESSSLVNPVAGVSSAFSVTTLPGQSPLESGFQVQLNSDEGQSILGTITSFTETLGYTGGVGGTNEFLTYDESTLPFGFNPQLSFQAQTGNFVVGDTIEGSTSNATGKIIEITAGNQGTQNKIDIIKQSGPFVSGTTFATPAGAGTITNITGPNNVSSIVRTGLITIGNSYVNPADGKTYYSGPFAVGDTIDKIGSGSGNAVITSIQGDNGYTTVSFSQQKNPFAIGQTVECYVSLSDTSQSAMVCSGKIVDVIGENLGYGTVNIANQNGKFGIGEVIVNNANNSVATIVGIDGTNNGYGTISYINQTTTGAAGAFIPGEFLLYNGDAFAQVILDTQNVTDTNGQGNIGSVTVITGVELGGVFTATANIGLPFAGAQIQGSESGTIADYGGVAYLESAVLTVNNVAGTFFVGDQIVDNVGYGLASTAVTINVTATCNGFAYLGNGKLILEKTLGGIGEPAEFGTSNVIIDYDAANAPTQTNTIAVTVSNIAPDTQFINGDPVAGDVSGARGIVVTNCGPVPYPAFDNSTQLLTILPNKGSPAFEVGELIVDDRKGASVDGCNTNNGTFLIGDTVTTDTQTVGLSSFYEIPGSEDTILVLSSAALIPVGATITTSAAATLSGSPVGQTGIEFNLENPVSIPLGTVVTGAGLSGVLTSAATQPLNVFTFSADPDVPYGVVVVGASSGATGSVVLSDGVTLYVDGITGTFAPSEQLTWEFAATLDSYTQESSSITFNLTAPAVIPPGTVVVGKTSSAEAEIIGGFDTEYAAVGITGTFTQTEAIKWNFGGATYSSYLPKTEATLVFANQQTSLNIGDVVTATSGGSATGEILDGSGLTYSAYVTSGTFGATGTVEWETPSGATGTIIYGSDDYYIADQIGGTFKASENLTWGISGTTYSALYTSQAVDPQLRVTLTAPVEIPVDTTIFGRTSGASAVIIAGSTANYVVDSANGTFASGEPITWGPENTSAKIISGLGATGAAGGTQALTAYSLTPPPPAIPTTITFTFSSNVDISGATGDYEGTLVYGTSSKATALITTKIDDNQYSGPLSSVFGTFSQTETLAWGYVVNNVNGSFLPGDVISWNNASGNIFSTIPLASTNTPTIVFYLNSNFFAIPSIGDPIYNTSSPGAATASGIVTALSNPAITSNRYNYVVLSNIVGTFTQDNTTIGLYNASGGVVGLYTYYNYSGQYYPTKLFLTNVTGVFPSSGTLSNNRKVVSCAINKASSLTANYKVPQSSDAIVNLTQNSQALVSFGKALNPSFGYDAQVNFVDSPETQEFRKFDFCAFLPDSNYPTDNNLKPFAANFTVSNNKQNFRVGGSFATANGGGWGASQGTVTSVSADGRTIDVAFTSFTNGINPGNWCTSNLSRGVDGTTDIGTGNFIYTQGFRIATDPARKYATSITYTSSTPYLDIQGIIQDVVISSSSAYVQTSKPPANTTALTLTNIDGTFTNGSLVKDLTTNNFGSVQDFNETTNYTGEVTTLTVENVVGLPTTGDLISNSGKTATINSVVLANGSFLVEPLTGTFVEDEKIIDLGSLAKATYLGSTPQTITGQTSGASATVVIDSGIQLKLDGVTGGAFQEGEVIESSLGVQAQIVGFPLFGVGNTLANLDSSSSGIIVSDNGSEVVIKNVQGSFTNGEQISSEGSSATLESVGSPVLNIVPLSSAGESNSWVISQAPLTSSSVATPGEPSLFTTNLTVNQTFFNPGDDLVVTNSDAILTVEQLYYPENVVQVDLESGNYSVETLKSLFPSDVITGPQYVVLVQDFESTSSLWSPVASIVIGTQFVTVREEYSGTPITIGTGNLGSNASTGSFQKVLLETPIEVLPQTSWRGLLLYEQKIEKLSSLGLSREDLKNLDVQLYWRNRLTNSLTPLTLYNGGSANIRLLFKRIHE